MSSAQTGESLTDPPQPINESLADSTQPAVEPVRHIPPPRRSNLATWLTLGLAVIATLATLPLIWTPIALQPYRSVMHPEWHLYLLGAQLLALPFFLLFGGLPRSRGGWCVLLAANLEIVALACLSALDLLNLAAVHVLVLGLRLAIVALWLFVVVGLLSAIWRLLNRSAGSTLKVSTRGKLWLAACVFLLAAEPAAAVLSRVLDDHSRIKLPNDLPLPPPDEIHVAFVGESTMAGFPYLKFGIPKVVGWQLEQMYPDRKVVLDDVSAVGLNLRTALLRLNTLTVRPQLLLLYSGHNEFFYDVEELATDLDTPWERCDWLFEWSPLFRVLDRRISRHIGVRDLEAQGARALVDRPIASREACERRLARFDGQLEQLASWCERLKIAGVWFVPAGTEADYAPNRSCLPGATDSQRAEIESIAREAGSLVARAQWQDAGNKYQAALERYPDFADFHFQLADCLKHEGRPKDAAPHYTQALELDGLPVRMIAPWRHKIAEVAGRHAIPVVESDAVLRPHTPSGILDRSVFLDYVHPNLRAYYDLGLAAVERIGGSSSLISGNGPPKPPAHTNFASAIAWAGFTQKDLALAYWRTAEADRWMTRLRFESSHLTRDARQYEDWSRRLESGQLIPGQAGTEALSSATSARSATIGLAKRTRLAPRIKSLLHPSARCTLAINASSPAHARSLSARIGSIHTRL
jgi:tetratricopeptide (TPR) repeat protein